MKKQDTKNVIVDAAMSCFLLKGYGGTSMDDIVKKSGVSKGGIYWHFKSKEDIFLHFIEREIANRKNDFEAILNKEDSLKVQLHKLLHWHTQEFQDFPMHILVGEFLFRVKDEEIINKFKEILLRHQRNDVYIKNILRQGIEKGEFKKIDVEAISEIISSFVEGCIMRYLIFNKNVELLGKSMKLAEEIFLQSILK